MKLTWYGLACFYLEGKDASVLMDPFDDTVGYEVPYVEADLWTCSHDHYDHNHGASVLNSDALSAVDGLDTGTIKTAAVKSWHDDRQGAVWGENTIWVVTLEGMRIAHLGDLGHLLTPEHLEQIGPVDLLLVPTGGIYTIDERAAAGVVRSMGAKLVIPMHYQTNHLRGFELNEGVDAFIEELEHYRIQRHDSNCLEITPALLEEPTVVVLTFK